MRQDVDQIRSNPSVGRQSSHGEDMWEAESLYDPAHPIYIDNYDPNNPHVLTRKISESPNHC